MKKINFSLSKLFNNNKFIVVLSVIIALVAWMMVAINIDDNQIARIDNIPIQFDTTSTELQGLSLIEGQDQKVSVIVEGVRYQIGNLTADDIIATADLRNVTSTGEQEVQIRVEKADPTNNNYVITSVSPAIVTLRFDRMNSKVMTLNPVAPNVEAAEGFRIDTITATPRELSISGPQAELDLIASCNVEYDDNETADDTIVVDGKLVFYGADGKKLTEDQIPHVTYTQQDFSITIPILMQKTVPINVSFINTNGLDMSKLRYDMTTDYLDIAGPRNIIEGREEITIGPIDMNKVDLDSTFTLEIHLDAGIINETGVETILVAIDTSGMDRKTLNIEKDNILLPNVPADYTVTIRSANIQNVKMVGNKEDIEDLSSMELIAQADSLQNIKEGSNRVRVNIYATGGKFVWAVGEYYILVNAVKK